jgi:hypothetical protein
MQRVLAHTVAGVTCPGCKMQIVEKGDFTDPKTHMVVATPEDLA